MWKLLPSPVLLAALLLASCGGGSDSSPDSSSSSSSSGSMAVVITDPAQGTSTAEGDSVTLSGQATGVNGQNLSADQLVWTTGNWTEIGTGTTVTTAALSSGQHTFVLTATDPGGASASASVTIMVLAAAVQPPPRFGELNPLVGRLQRTPVKLDDELVVIGAGGTQLRLTVGVIDAPLGYYETDSQGNPRLPSEPIAPRLALERDSAEPIAAAAGRALNSNLHQVALLSAAAGSGPLLELLSVSDLGLYRIAEYSLPALLLEGSVAMTVADIDAFDEVSGGKAMTRPTEHASRYHEEVVLAYPEVDNGGQRVRVLVLSFEDVHFPEAGVDTLPGPTSEVSALSSRPMWPGSKIVVTHGDQLTNNPLGPHLLLAYLDTSGRIVVDVFIYERTRTDLETGTAGTDSRNLVPVDLLADDPGVEHLVVSSPLTEAAANAGGWDVGITTGHQVGTSDTPLQTKNLLHVVWHNNGGFQQAVWDMDSPDGFADPNRIAIASGPFGIYDGTFFGGTEVPLSILPNSPMQLEFGRITRPGEFCEAIGLFVLANTNRGPVVQDLSAHDLVQVQVGPAGNELGLITERPVWPGLLTLRDRGETDQVSPASLVAGGLVFERNALIDERGNPAGVGIQYAEDCDSGDVNTRPFLGPMPSFYVAEPEAGQLHSVTLSLGRTEGGGGTVTAPLGEIMSGAPILLAADIDGNAGYYGAATCIFEQPNQSSPSDCRTIYLGDAELHYTLENIESESVILQQPPKHVDYLPALGGIVDISMSDAYYAEFSQTDTAGGSITQKNKTDWMLGSRLGGSLGKPAPPKTDYKPMLSMHIDAEVGATTESFDSNEVTVSLTQTTGAVDDDVIWSRVQNVDFWRFPAQGGKPDGRAGEESDFDEDAYMDISIPGEPVTMIGPGVLNDSYQPGHQVGNILTYPTFHGEVDDLGELFNYLGNYIPSDANGARQCMPVDLLDEFGCLIRAGNNLLHRVTEVHPDDDFVGGRFVSQTNAIDVAEVLQVGGISYSAELKFDEQVRSGDTVTYNAKVGVEATARVPIKIPVKGIPLQVGEVESQVRASMSAETALISENTMGSSATIALHVPSSIPVGRSYRIRPSFGYSPQGTLKVAYQVSTDGAASGFWEAHYSAPDPALNLPHRIIRTSGGYQLGTDFSRNRLQGFFVRDGSEVDPLRQSETAGILLSGVPREGEQVQLEVLVYNLSLGTSVSNLAVKFEAQRYQSGQPAGERMPLGESIVDYLPHRGQFPELPNGHVASVYYLWDTTGFGPQPGATLGSYLIYVTLDPDNAIPNEVHELFDRNDDPLLSVLGVPIDEELEKGQNNRGWSMVRIAPSLSADPSMQTLSTGADDLPMRRIAGSVSEQEPLALTLSRLDDGLDVGVLNANVGEAVELRVGIRSDSLQLAYGRLLVWDGDPEAGGQVILSRTVQGLSGEMVTHEDFVWRPARAGHQSLHVTYISGVNAGRHTLQVPALIDN